jgi:hypothetical protein
VGISLLTFVLPSLSSLSTMRVSRRLSITSLPTRSGTIDRSHQDYDSAKVTSCAISPRPISSALLLGLPKLFTAISCTQGSSAVGPVSHVNERQHTHSFSINGEEKKLCSPEGNTFLLYFIILVKKRRRRRREHTRKWLGEGAIGNSFLQMELRRERKKKRKK